MPGRSRTRPPRMSTTECSCRLCPSPGMYAPTSIPFVRRTRATFRRAEFGFLGVCVITRVQTPRRCGAPCSAGVLVRDFGAVRPFLTSWFTVGTDLLLHTQIRSAGRVPPTGLGMVAKPVLHRQWRDGWVRRLKRAETAGARAEVAPLLAPERV